MLAGLQGVQHVRAGRPDTRSPMSHPPSHARVAEALRAHRLGTQPGDLHGSLTGYLCAGGRLGPDDWLDRLELSPADAASARDETLAALRAAAFAQFGAVPAAIEPLLPPATAPMPERAEALVDWCRGFLGGYGLGALHGDLSADAREILADFGTIAASRLDVEGGARDEQAFAEVLDFVRTAAALLHRESEHRRAASPPPH